MEAAAVLDQLELVSINGVGNHIAIFGVQRIGNRAAHVDGASAMPVEVDRTVLAVQAQNRWPWPDGPGRTHERFQHSPVARSV